MNGTVDIGAVEGARIQPPEEQVTELISEIQDDLDLPNGLETSLTSDLNYVVSKLTDTNVNNDVAAVNSLNAAINNLESQSGKKILESDA